MSFSLNASGHVPAANPAVGTAQDAAATELALYEALRGVLADPRYGVTNSSFGGQHVTGSLHAPDE